MSLLMLIVYLYFIHYNNILVTILLDFKLNKMLSEAGAEELIHYVNADS